MLGHSCASISSHLFWSFQEETVKHEEIEERREGEIITIALVILSVLPSQT